MKKLITSIFVLFLIIPFAMAQTVQQGMKYQAVARDLKGEIMANQQIVLKIKLHNHAKTTTVNYTELHSTVTNQFGLFSLVIGDGKIEKGKFSEIPWSTEDIWMTIEIKGNKNGDFTKISSTKLLAVPYAYYALEAGELSGEDFEMNNFKTPKLPKPSKSGHWDIEGNIEAEDKSIAPPLLGNADYAPISIITNNLERLRITADGALITPEDVGLTLGGDLEVQGDNTSLNNNLYVGRDVFLNESDEFDPIGETINFGNFTVESMSSTLLTGTLDVLKETNLESDFFVNNESATALTGTLNVNLDAQFDKNVIVSDTLFADVLETNKLNFKADVPNGEFLATFENINSGNGDGINIMLGKTHPRWNGSDYIQSTNPLAEYFDINVGNIKGIVIGGNAFTFTDALELMPSALIAGTTCKMVDGLIGKINTGLNLPLTVSIPELSVGPKTLFGGINMPSIAGVGIPDIPSISLPKIYVPGTPTDLFTIPAIPNVCDDLPSLSMPNISIVDVSNTLTNSNHYIDFSDKDNQSLGSIRAQSITNWGTNYFNSVWLTGFIAETIGIDPLDAMTGIVSAGTEIIDSYNSIGVEYTSGNGDYAEWLERLDPNEIISKGDIVGIIGGKITKNIENAEQIMAVSEKPIMLGNIPEKNKENLGNNVAFMGQIPVKIMDAVNSGDYIIADNKIPGYGIAKNPSELTIDDTKYIVGRSWDTNLKAGPKMVNTVIGVHNGDYLKIIKKFRDEFNQAVNRLDNLEAKIDALTNGDLIIANNK